MRRGVMGEGEGREGVTNTEASHPLSSLLNAIYIKRMTADYKVCWAACVSEIHSLNTL